MINICMYGCRSCNFSCQYCMGPQNTSKELFILDEIKLKESIELVQAKKNKYQNFYVWGGEPLLHFSELSETISFLKNNFPDRKISFSTNGYLLTKKEIRNFIKNNQLRIQLSVDGIAQNIRSNFNPLDHEEIAIFLSEMANNNLLSINCVMHNKNYSIDSNITYFKDWMIKYDCLKSKLNIRFTPFNESVSTPAYNFSGKHLEIFIHEFEKLYIQALLGNPNHRVYKHFIKYPLKIVKESNFRKCEWEDLNQCSKIYSGKKDISSHIDTKGNFLSCNLIDSGILPRGEMQKEPPEYCSSCEFYKMRGCWPCPASDFPSKCEFKKAWMYLQQRMLLLKKLYYGNKSDALLSVKN